MTPKGRWNPVSDADVKSEESIEKQDRIQVMLEDVDIDQPVI